MSDDQIKQSLAAGGWKQEDIDRTFGAPATPSATANNKAVKIIIAVVILLFLIPFLFWAGIAGYGYYKLKQGGVKVETSGTNNNPASGSADQPTCERSDLSANLPSDWPSDIPIYPGSQLAASSQITLPGGRVATAIFCTKDSPTKVISHFLNSKTAWNIQKFYSENVSKDGVTVEQTILSGKKEAGNQGLLLTVISSGGNTAITIQASINSQ